MMNKVARLCIASVLVSLAGSCAIAKNVTVLFNAHPADGSAVGWVQPASSVSYGDQVTITVSNIPKADLSAVHVAVEVTDNHQHNVFSDFVPKPSGSEPVASMNDEYVTRSWGPYPAKGDCLTITLTGISDVSASPLHLDIYDRTVWDLSGALVVTGLTDEKAHTNGTSGKLVSDGKDSSNYSIPTPLALFHPTGDRWVTWTGAFGLSVGNPQRVFVGGGVLLGQGQKVAITIGGAFGTVKRLNGDQTALEDRQDTKWFAAVSYNVGSF